MHIAFSAAVCVLLLSQCLGKDVFKQSKAFASGEAPEEIEGRSGPRPQGLRQLLLERCGPPPPRPQPGQTRPPLTRDQIINATTLVREAVLSIAAALQQNRPLIEAAMAQAEGEATVDQLIARRDVFQSFQGILMNSSDSICGMIPLRMIAKQLLNQLDAEDEGETETPEIEGLPDGGCARSNIVLERCRDEFGFMSDAELAGELRANLTIVQVLAREIVLDIGCVLNETAALPAVDNLTSLLIAARTTVAEVRAQIIAADSYVRLLIQHNIDLLFVLEKLSGAIILLENPAERRVRIAQKLLGLLESLTSDDGRLWR